jgi:hypothetical protein
MERLNAAAQARYGLDVNGGMRVATGLALDLNGVSKFLWQTDWNQNFDGLLALLSGGVLFDGTANSYIETSDKAALDIVGDIDIRVEFMYWTPTLGNAALVAKWTPAAQQSYLLLNVPAFSALQLHTSSTGANDLNNQLGSVPFIRYAAIRATLDVDNGAAGRTARFYSAPNLDGPFVEMSGSPVTTAGVTTIFNSTAVLRLGALGDGSNPFNGRIHRAEIRNGIDGTVVANPDLRNVAVGATSFVDGAGNTWNVGSAAKVV